jgi:tRNA-splicing ligase RtcB
MSRKKHRTGVTRPPAPKPARAPLTLVPETPDRHRIEPTGAMRVPGVVYASHRLLPSVDDALRQVANVATLPGIVRASFAMPDVHWGYGFPIGGVAATDPAAGGVVSPGGVGFDISCGVRLLTTPFTEADLRPRLPAVMAALSRLVPRGAGPGGVWDVTPTDLRAILRHGSAHAVARGYGSDLDLAHCEDGGAVDDADPAAISDRALARGAAQVGSLGSGNHFLELQVVDRILDPATAAGFGLAEGQVTVMIHCGSRGLGHQICSDHVRLLQDAMPQYGIRVPDAQLACAPVDSREGRAYLGAMAAAANFARANRHLLAHAARQAFREAAGSGDLDLLYDVSHNLAKLEQHGVRPWGVTGEHEAGEYSAAGDVGATGGGDVARLVCVHRKGATLSLPPGHPALPDDLRPHGQPVLVPGSMGTASWVLAGERDNPAFDSACHGAGRVMSRTAATKRVSGRRLQEQLAAQGIEVRAASTRGLAEEAPFAYKDVDEVVAVCGREGLARPVARLRPIGVVKG